MSIHKYPLKRGGVGYKAVIQVSSTKQVAKRFKRKVDAETWEREQRHLLDKDGLPDSQHIGMTVRELGTYWLVNYAKVYMEVSSAKVDESILRLHILPPFGSKRLLDVTPALVEGWLERLRSEKQLSSKMCNLCLGMLRKMLTDAVRWRFIRYNPIQAIKPLKLADKDFAFWTAEEAATFLAYAKTEAADLYPLFATALYTGMRLGELKALQWDAVDLGRRQLTVKRTFCNREGRVKETTKSKRIRRVPINQSLLEILVELRAKATTAAVLPELHYNHASKTLRRLAAKAGVRPLRFHDMRHSFASILMMAGGSIYDLQRMLGHSTIQMTERYSHLSPEHLAGKTELLDFGTRSQDNVVRLHAASASGSRSDPAP